MSRARLGIAFSIALIGSLAAWRSGESIQPPASALPPIDSTILKSLKWRNVGPERGGRSIAISGVKGQPKVGYFGATGGGLWKTIDGGEPLGEHHHRRPAAQLGRSGARIAVSLSDPNTIFHRHGQSRAFAAISSRETASTNRPTPARRGLTSASRTPTRSRAFEFIRPIRTSSSLPISGNTASTAKSAGSSNRPTAARPGATFYIRARAPAASTSK